MPDANDFSSGDDGGDGVVHGQAGVLVQELHHFREGLADGVLLAPGGEVFGRRVEELDEPPAVGGDDGVTDAVQDGGEPLLPPQQLLLGALALGDVDHHAEDAGDFALEVAQGGR
jgi:hypothetical protein